MYKLVTLLAFVAAVSATPGNLVAPLAYSAPFVAAHPAPIAYTAPVVAPVATSYANTLKLSYKTPVIASAPLVAAAPAHYAYAAPFPYVASAPIVKTFFR
ncbi:cuticle protein 38-like [Hetaerina americana]|uniref:cuticle protein 38-like n=1 Tax=Hetaerina americana TaxID=62018 RepID=UPI003A7F30A5